MNKKVEINLAPIFESEGRQSATVDLGNVKSPRYALSFSVDPPPEIGDTYELSWLPGAAPDSPSAQVAWWEWLVRLVRPPKPTLLAVHVISEATGKQVVATPLEIHGRYGHLILTNKNELENIKNLVRHD